MPRGKRAVVVRAPGASRALARLEKKEAQIRTRHRIQRMSKHNEQLLAQAKNKSKEILAAISQNTLAESAVQFGGQLGESILALKAPKAQKYAAVAGLGIEFIAMWKLSENIGSAKRIEEWKLLAAAGRGLRNRATTTLTDEIAAKIVGATSGTQPSK